MTGVVDEDAQIRFVATEQLRTDLYAVFKEQGVNQKTGMIRLAEFLINAPVLLRPVILRQVEGPAAAAIARAAMKEFIAALEDPKLLRKGATAAQVAAEAAQPHRKSPENEKGKRAS